MSSRGGFWISSHSVSKKGHGSKLHVQFNKRPAANVHIQGKSLRVCPDHSSYHIPYPSPLRVTQSHSIKRQNQYHHLFDRLLRVRWRWLQENLGLIITLRDNFHLVNPDVSS